MLVRYIQCTYEYIVISIQLDECPQNEHICVTIIHIKKQNIIKSLRNPWCLTPITFPPPTAKVTSILASVTLDWILSFGCFFFHLYEFWVGVLHFSKLFIIARSRTQLSFHSTFFSIK